MQAGHICALVLCRSAATNGASQRSRSACQSTSIDRLSICRSAMNHRTTDSGIPSCAESAKVVLDPTMLRIYHSVSIRFFRGACTTLRHCLLGGHTVKQLRRERNGRGILLRLLGVPIPIIIILALIWH
jgi:hypothetical protein